MDWSRSGPARCGAGRSAASRRRLGGVVRADQDRHPPSRSCKHGRRRHPAAPAARPGSRARRASDAERADEDLVVARDDPAGRPDPAPETQGTAIAGHVGHQAEEHGELRHDSEHDRRDQLADAGVGVEPRSGRRATRSTSRQPSTASAPPQPPVVEDVAEHPVVRPAAWPGGCLRSGRSTCSLRTGMLRPIPGESRHRHARAPHSTSTVDPRSGPPGRRGDDARAGRPAAARRRWHSRTPRHRVIQKVGVRASRWATRKT